MPSNRRVDLFAIKRYKNIEGRSCNKTTSVQHDPDPKEFSRVLTAFGAVINLPLLCEQHGIRRMLIVGSKRQLDTVHRVH